MDNDAEVLGPTVVVAYPGIKLPDGSTIKNGLATPKQVSELCREDSKTVKGELMDDVWGTASNPNNFTSTQLAGSASRRAQARAAEDSFVCRFILDQYGVRPVGEAHSATWLESELNHISEWWDNSFDARYIRFMALVASLHPALWVVRARSAETVYQGATRFGYDEFYSWQTTSSGYRVFGKAASSRLSTEQYTERLVRYMAGARRMKVEVVIGEKATQYIEAVHPTTDLVQVNGLFYRSGGQYGGPRIYLRPGLSRIEVHHEMQHYYNWLPDPALYASQTKHVRELDVILKLQNSKRWVEAADLEPGQQIGLFKPRPGAPHVRYSEYERGIQQRYLESEFQKYIDFDFDKLLKKVREAQKWAAYNADWGG